MKKRSGLPRALSDGQILSNQREFHQIQKVKPEFYFLQPGKYFDRPPHKEPMRYED